MSEVTTLFWDVGGVLLTNGWDTNSRRAAAARFQLEAEEFEDRHQLLVTPFETGRLSLEEYLDRTVFYRPRPFSADEFKAFMRAQSQPHPETLAVLERLARTRRYVLVTLNNEPLELNLYRIQQFGLRRYFMAFFSSCFLGVKKPEDAIYRLALQITQCAPEECLYIDDRALNLECAGRRGMRTILFRSAAQLEHELHAVGIEF